MKKACFQVKKLKFKFYIVLCLFLQSLRFNGSYEKMESGQPSYAYLSLTGGTPELLYYGHSFYKDKFDSESVYKRVSNALQSGSLVVGSASAPNSVSTGLVLLV